MPLPVDTSKGTAKPPTMPKTASQTAFCSTASKHVNAVSTNSTANARPAGISSYRRKAPNVTSINIASAVPCSGKLMPGRWSRMRQAQASSAMSASAMPARRSSMGTVTCVDTYLSRKLTPRKRISKPSLATRLPVNNQFFALATRPSGWAIQEGVLGAAGAGWAGIDAMGGAGLGGRGAAGGTFASSTGSIRAAFDTGTSTGAGSGTETGTGTGAALFTAGAATGASAWPSSACRRACTLSTSLRKRAVSNSRSATFLRYCSTCTKAVISKPNMISDINPNMGAAFVDGQGEGARCMRTLPYYQEAGDFCCAGGK